MAEIREALQAMPDSQDQALNASRLRVLAALRGAPLRHVERATKMETSIHGPMIPSTFRPAERATTTRGKTENEKITKLDATLRVDLLVLWKRRHDHLSPAREEAFLRDVEAALYLPEVEDYLQ